MIRKEWKCSESNFRSRINNKDWILKIWNLKALKRPLIIKVTRKTTMTKCHILKKKMKTKKKLRRKKKRWKNHRFIKRNNKSRLMQLRNKNLKLRKSTIKFPKRKNKRKWKLNIKTKTNSNRLKKKDLKRQGKIEGKVRKERRNRMISRNREEIKDLRGLTSIKTQQNTQMILKKMI